MDKQNKNIKVCLLGHGPLAEPAFEAIKNNFNVTEKDQADLAIVANYGKILTADELTSFTIGAFNIHPSLLPKYRGPAPVQQAIIDGEKTSGLTIFKMDEKVDHGPVVSQKQFSVDENDTTESILDKAGKLAGETIVDVLNDYLSGKTKLIAQDEKLATYTKKLQRSDCELKTLDDPKILFNMVRAFSKEPGAFVKLDDGTDLIIRSAKVINGELVPTVVQKQGKKEMSYNQFLQGFRGNKPF